MGSRKEGRREKEGGRKRRKLLTTNMSSYSLSILNLRVTAPWLNALAPPRSCIDKKEKIEMKVTQTVNDNSLPSVSYTVVNGNTGDTGGAEIEENF